MASLIQYGNIYTMKGLFQGIADLRDLTQYKYAKETVLPKCLFQCYHQLLN